MAIIKNKITAVQFFRNFVIKIRLVKSKYPDTFEG